MAELANGKTVLLLSLLLFLGACGVKTHPYPESMTLPGQVVDLEADQDSQGGLVLRWRAPEENMAGRPLRSILFFEVLAADYDLDEFCAGCPSFYRKAAEIHVQPPPPGLSINPGPYSYSLKLKEGRVYRFRVAAFSERGAAHPDAWSEITVRASLGPGELSGFRADLGDREVRLYFDRMGPGETAEIERRIGDGPFRRLPLTGREYTDLDVSYGSVYVYRGRKVLETEHGPAPGPWSREITARVEDRFPPRPIGYLDASPAEGGILLKWEDLSMDDDIKGYRLYRRLGDAGEFQPINGLFTSTSHLDAAVVPGGDYRYRVTAVDASPAANESLPSPEASVSLETAEEPAEKPDLTNLGY
ncbi:MAG: fibronectin type III domain-containing protein [Deltaproteobacteria bacterium]|jgi:hypothetical protein|nr:fibronectin type III domain-containing protein [Deltaproteobacteria bacterium]